MEALVTRRGLLKLLLATAAAEVADFDKLLWVPRPIITVPPGYTLTSSAIHIDYNLTDISVAYIRSMEPFVCDRMFPIKKFAISGYYGNQG